MLDHSHIGRALTPYSVLVEAGRLRFFALATAQSDPVYFDSATAEAAGYPALLAPPTFLFCLEFESPQRGELYRLLDIDIARILHGEQSFAYRRQVFAGDRLDYAGRIANIYVKRSRSGGELGFIEIETTVSNAERQVVAELRRVTVVKPA
ncbi:acyl dehydratase [Chromobacterium alkanivorans]|uniref:MaoC family dehydratase N-terminal domain-containing protein n=1 Tax=Chromobacterium alkanivorans TaxID=1071719 RepID=UPI0021672931|nr:MaoC family dehydratase N-terminal domain-containing protein [Chromobacterium alkanivorans]MCS3806593.1 acyl dehydratase [Chromobacterium alkanivorans]MCS3820931.1 acyl dehydratase [Chromobacterium alkanivorans]MCS3875853.1 acyl dehydratase [Chromobacterium alkanivorans]